jgi:hypothetical protein
MASFKAVRSSKCAVSYGNTTVVFSFLSVMVDSWYDVDNINNKMNMAAMSDNMLDALGNTLYAQQEAFRARGNMAGNRFFEKVAIISFLEPVVRRAITVLDALSYKPVDGVKDTRVQTCESWFRTIVMKNLRQDGLPSVLSILCGAEDEAAKKFTTTGKKAKAAMMTLSEQDFSGSLRAGIFGMKAEITGERVRQAMSKKGQGGGLAAVFNFGSELMKNDSVVWRNFSKPIASGGQIDNACATDDRGELNGRVFRMFHYLFHKRGRPSESEHLIFPAIGMTPSEFHDKFSVGFVATTWSCLVNSFVFENGGNSAGAPKVSDWVRVFIAIELTVRADYDVFLKEQRRNNPSFLEVRFGGSTGQAEAVPAAAPQQDEFAMAVAAARSSMM